MKVIDNFLGDYQFEMLRALMMGFDFPWYFNDRILHPTHDNYDEDLYQFTHGFYLNNGEKVSEFFQHLEYCILKLKAKHLIRVKANLTSGTLFHQGGGYHCDYDNKTFDDPLNTAILYINTNNGFTKFKKGGKVKAVENRLVIFDFDQEHQGFTCTNEKRKIVINFNYVPSDDDTGMALRVKPLPYGG